MHWQHALDRITKQFDWTIVCFKYTVIRYKMIRIFNIVFCTVYVYVKGYLFKNYCDITRVIKKYIL